MVEQGGYILKIMITDRKGIETLSLMPFEIPTAVVSITDYDYTYANLKHKPQHLLQVAFDDVPVGDGFEEEYGRKLSSKEITHLEKKFNSITEEQILQISLFFKRVQNKVDLIICQCEHGQSRSAAIAAAFMENKYKSGIDIFADDRYYPNKSIFRKVLRTLNNIK